MTGYARLVERCECGETGYDWHVVIHRIDTKRLDAGRILWLRHETSIWILVRFNTCCGISRMHGYKPDDDDSVLKTRFADLS
jgi:hypothetical protein